MKKTMLVMLHEIRTTLRRKSFVILALGLPLLLGAIALIVATVNRDAVATLAETAAVDVTQRMPEGYVDEGGLIEALPSDLPAGWLTGYPDQAAAQAALEAGQITAYAIIPADYVETGDLTYVLSEYNPIGDGPDIGALEWTLTFNLLGDADLAAGVWNPLEVQRTSLAPVEAEADQDNWIVERLPGLMVLILYMVIVVPSGILVSAVTDEKKNRVMEVLMSSISSQQMLTGKILALGLLGLLWAVVSLGGRSLNIPPGFALPRGLPVWMLVYGLLGFCMYGAQMAGLGALAPDVKDVRSASFIIMLPLILVYVFAFPISAAPHGPLALVLSLFPLTSPIAMIARMAQAAAPLWQALLAAVLQLLTAIWIVRLVARMFRAQHLLSGQPFSLQRYFRALLGPA
jgi:ABC-2 type transport system permease protein